MTLDLAIEKDCVSKVCEEKKGLERRIRDLENEKDVINEEFEAFRLDKRTNESTKEQENRSENVKNKNKLKIAGDVIIELKKEIHELNSNKEEKEQQIVNLNLVLQESALLEKELADKSVQISELKCEIVHLETKVKDQNDDIDTKAEMIMDLESSQRKNELKSSQNSLADEIQEVLKCNNLMEVKLLRLEKSKGEKLALIKHLEELYDKRVEE